MDADGDVHQRIAEQNAEERDEWKARALAAEADREATRKDSDAWQMQWRTVSAERDEARAALRGLLEVRAVPADEPKAWLETTVASLEAARAALSPSPPDKEAT